MHKRKKPADFPGPAMEKSIDEKNISESATAESRDIMPAIVFFTIFAFTRGYARHVGSRLKGSFGIFCMLTSKSKPRRLLMTSSKEGRFSGACFYKK